MRATLSGLILVLSGAHGATAAKLENVVVQAEPMAVERRFEGRVEAVHQSTVSAETPGRVAAIFVDVGDAVPAGTVILSLVGKEQREALNQAEAALAEARAQREVQAREFQRLTELAARKLVSGAELDRGRAAFDAAKARMAGAEAGLKRAREQVGYTEVRAPYGGVVAARHVEVGEAVQPGMALMTGFDPKALRVHVDLPQAVAAAVGPSGTARVLLNGESLSPTMLRLYPQADPATSTVRARLDLPEGLTGLYPGQFVPVAFRLGEARRLLVPARALVHRAELTGVYVLEDGQPSLRQLRLGERFGEAVEVLSGLTAGERVALDPVAADRFLAASLREGGGQ